MYSLSLDVCGRAAALDGRDDLGGGSRLQLGRRRSVAATAALEVAALVVAALKVAALVVAALARGRRGADARARAAWCGCARPAGEGGGVMPMRACACARERRALTAWRARTRLRREGCVRGAEEGGAAGTQVRVRRAMVRVRMLECDKAGILIRVARAAARRCGHSARTSHALASHRLAAPR
jgi:hypothetical protein